MSVLSSLVRLLSAFVRLVVFALVVGVVVAAVLPGGPLHTDLLAGPGTPSSSSTATPASSMPQATASTPPDQPQGPSPWGKQVLVVAIRNRAAPSRNITGAVAGALHYWSTHEGYSDYPATFRLEPNAAHPDVVVWYNDSIECPHHADAIGCAPLLEGGSRVDPPVNVQIRYDPSDNQRQVRNTVIHEFGHVLGITHCEPPYWVMSSTCTESIPDAPNDDQRDLAWRDHTLSVYVDYANVSPSERAATRAQVGHALGYFENASPADFPGNVTLVPAADRYSADLSVVFTNRSVCREGAVVCYDHRGRDYDGDGHIEYHTNGLVRIGPGTDVNARGWYVGWALAHQLAPGHVPSVFVDASYRERRGQWWT